jgi:hypothetical protein
MLGVVVFGRSKFSLSAKIAEFATSAKQIALGSSVLCNCSRFDLEFTVIHEVFFLIIIASLPNYYLSLIAILIFEIISDI